MSGSDSGFGGGLGTGGQTLVCDTIAFETMLSSPKPDVVSLLSVGTVLEINLQTTNGFEIVVASFNGQAAGGLVLNADKIKSCIERGFSYEAKVREIKGARVTVFVYCK